MGNIESIIGVLAQGYIYTATHILRDQTGDAYEKLNRLIESRCVDDARPQVMRGYKLYTSYPDRPELWSVPLGDSLRLLGADRDQGILTMARVLAGRLPGVSAIDYDDEDEARRRGRRRHDIMGYRQPGDPGVDYEDDHPTEDVGRGMGDPGTPYEPDDDEGEQGRLG